MKNLIRIICAALVCGLLTTCLTGGTKLMAADDTTALFDTAVETKKYEQLKLLNNDIEVQFRVSAPIRALQIYISKSVSSSKEDVFYTRLYRWAGSIGESLRGEVLAEQAYTRPETGATVEFDLTAGGTKAPVEAGEYVLYMGEAKIGIVIGLVPGGSDKVRTYFNTSAVKDRTAAVSVVWAEGAGELLPVSDNDMKFVRSADTWVVTDGLGRTVNNSYTDTRREGKTVGLFFHTWHSSNSALGTRNITSILKEHPEIQNDFTSPLWGTAGAYFWNEPIWGYYRSDDEWVLRKQAELLADAGVDAVFFDNTNGTMTFIDDALTLCKVWSKARADGVNTPKISFMLPMFEYKDVAVQLREIYTRLYGAGLYQDLWFYWKGKPLIVGYPGQLNSKNKLDAEILEFFNFRVINHSQSADNIQVQNEDGTPVVMGAIQPEVKESYQLWNWISVYPQLINCNPDGTPEQVAVAIAHNWCAETHLTAMNNPKFQVFGRHYDPVKGQVDDRENAKLYGKYFSTQWEYALEVDPEFIWVTGWNEWVAGRFQDFWGVENAFPDNFSDEYSRDIEPSRGDLKDHYYYLLVNYIRRYKGTSAAQLCEPATIDISTGADWEQVDNVYETYTGDTFDRNARGYVNNETNKPFKYTNDTGRNDIVLSKATFDADNVYFMVQTAEPLTPYTDPAWMRLLLEVESMNGIAPQTKGDWESFQYIINRNTPADATHALLEVSTGGWNWEAAGEVTYSVSGNTLQIAVPRALLGLAHADEFVLNFKWSDNMQVDGDILDFYENGDVAPEGRYKYQLAAGKAPERPSEDDNAQNKDRSGNNKSVWIAAAAAGAAALAAVGAAIGVLSARKKKGGK